MANYYETDQMGVVHHSNHIRYFEEARLDFMRTIGCDAAEMEKDGIIIPNVDAYAKYEKPVRFADRVHGRNRTYHPLLCRQGIQAAVAEA